MEMSPLLHFVEHPFAIACKLIMVTVYTYRVIHLLTYAAGVERQAPTGSLNTTQAKGVLYSWANIAMPQSMESTRKKPFFYAQFIIFHLGMVAVIALTVVIPYTPEVLKNIALVRILQVMMGAAFVVGIYRLFRRIFNKHIRAISSPDDYFSVAMLDVLFVIGILAAPNNIEQGEGALLTFFFLTAFFHVYVPFSKIMHYVYYPFTRYYFGKSMGRRGVFPVRQNKGDQ